MAVDAVDGPPQPYPMLLLDVREFVRAVAQVEAEGVGVSNGESGHVPRPTRRSRRTIKSQTRYVMEALDGATAEIDE